MAAAFIADTSAMVHTYVKVPDLDSRERISRDVSEIEHRVQEAARFAVAEDMAQVHILGRDLKIDDRDATVVMIFPRAHPYGPLDAEEIVQDPLRQAQNIFEREHNMASKDSLHAGFESFAHAGPVSLGQYQKAVRGKLLELLGRSGFKVSTFESVDGDEVFAKISLDIDGQVIRQLAQRWSYQMPFTARAYEDVKPHGRFQGREPMFRNGRPVPAFGPYQQEISNLMEEFRPIDEIRLIETQLHSLVSMEQLKRQGVISNFFPVAKHSDIQKLHREWLQVDRVRGFSSIGATCAKVFEVPQYGSKSGLVRNFFGEEIAFFFRWFAFYTQMLGYLGAFGVALFAVESAGPALGWSDGAQLAVRRYTPLCFSAITVVWATCFNQLFRNRMARAQQDWGMKEYESSTLSLDRAEYDFAMDGTWKQSALRAFSCSICLFFCVMFIAVICLIEEKKKEQMEDEGRTGTFFKDYGSLIVVSTIKAWSIGWGYIAPLLAEMQNHRTHASFDDALTTMLALVKIFVTLWNFLYVAFITKWSSPTCAESLEEVAKCIWQNANASEEALRELRTPQFSYTKHNGTVCAFGCYPASPELSRPGAYTNCYLMLQSELITFFFVHILYTVVFLLWPMVQVYWEVMKEVRKAKHFQDDVDGERRHYTWLQFQAKCPAYEYLSWGGSRVEDFLECAIGFALLTCFGILFPLLSFFAFLANMVEFRLLAYRMTHVTCRPLPRGASGIGSWQLVFEAISAAAVVVNVLLIVFVLYPMRSMELRYQLGVFIVLEHTLLGIRGVIGNVIPDCPQDVQRIEDFNAHFRRTMVKYPELDVPKEEQYEEEYKTVDLGLQPPLGRGFAQANGSDLSSEDEDSSPWCCGTPPAFSPL